MWWPRLKSNSRMAFHFELLPLWPSWDSQLSYHFVPKLKHGSHTKILYLPFTNLYSIIQKELSKHVAYYSYQYRWWMKLGPFKSKKGRRQVVGSEENENLSKREESVGLIPKYPEMVVLWGHFVFLCLFVGEVHEVYGSVRVRVQYRKVQLGTAWSNPYQSISHIIGKWFSSMQLNPGIIAATRVRQITAHQSHPLHISPRPGGTCMKNNYYIWWI